MFSEDVSWLDVNGDQQPDPVTTVDVNGDGILEPMSYTDMTGDGVPELVTMLDANGDGLADLIEINMHTGGLNILVDGPTIESALIDSDPLATSTIIGDPLDDMEHWQEQQSQNSCAIASQMFILDDLGEAQGRDFTEAELVQVATANGWYDPASGTPMHDVGNLLEAYGVPIERTVGNSLANLADRLSSGEKVIVGVDADEIWQAGHDPIADDGYGDWNMAGSIPGQDANHAVQVIGIDMSDPNQPVVILNDPGSPDGKGFRVPADEFVDAWNDSGNFMVSTAINGPSGLAMADNPNSIPMGSQLLGGYHDAEGNWIWNDGSPEPNYNSDMGYTR